MAHFLQGVSLAKHVSRFALQRLGVQGLDGHAGPTPVEIVAQEHGAKAPRSQDAHLAVPEIGLSMRRARAEQEDCESEEPGAAREKGRCRLGETRPPARGRSLYAVR